MARYTRTEYRQVPGIFAASFWIAVWRDAHSDSFVYAKSEARSLTFHSAFRSLNDNTLNFVSLGRHRGYAHVALDRSPPLLENAEASGLFKRARSRRRMNAVNVGISCCAPSDQSRKRVKNHEPQQPVSSQIAAPITTRVICNDLAPGQ